MFYLVWIFMPGEVEEYSRLIPFASHNICQVMQANIQSLLTWVTVKSSSCT